MHFNVSAATNAQKIFARNAVSSPITAAIPAKNGNKEKAQMHADTVLARSKR